jgi:ribosomal protein L11 methylase PrmA
MPEKISGSFRDPSGFMFKHEGKLYRQVNQKYSKEYDLLMGSGLYEQLSKSRTLVAHKEVDLQLAPIPETAYRVIEPEVVDFISYPYEWCFNQLQDAAVLTLAIARRALEFGMSLKDASAYNIQFQNGRPVFIDTLSFEKYEEGAPWVAYKQFCQHFLAPLALMAKKDIRLAQMMRFHIDGIPLDLTSKLLPASTKLNFGLATHIHIHAQSQKRYADKEVSQEEVKARMSKTAMVGLLDSLLSTVRGLNVKTIQTEWTDYYQDNNYTKKSFEAKRQLVKTYLEKANPKQVWDLGGNTGEFSRAASDLGIPTVCFDIDPGAVQQNYDLVKKNKEKFMLPLRMDLTNPSPDLGWHNAERESMQARGPVDLIMALALIHHLAISNNVPLVDVADYFADLGKYLIVEFVPKSDSQVKRLLASRLDIFPDYTLEGFRQAFEHHYLLIDETPIDACERTVFLMKRK